jgi:hypothetical protein
LTAVLPLKEALKVGIYHERNSELLGNVAELEPFLILARHLGFLGTVYFTVRFFPKDVS